MRSYESKPTPKRTSTGRRTQGNQTGNARAITTITRHPRPTALNHLFFLEATTDMTVECSRSRQKCLFDSCSFVIWGNLRIRKTRLNSGFSDLFWNSGPARLSKRTSRHASEGSSAGNGG